jgi:hypothetical protein
VRGFFHSLRPFLAFGFGLFVLAVLGELARAVGQWVGVPLSVVLMLVGIVAVLITARLTS